MPLLKCESRLYYFSHIPKTGGSSVEFAMRQAGAVRALHFHKKMDYVRCNLQHMHAELFDTFVPPDFYDDGFCVTRHPIARLVSEYYWRNSLGHVKAKFGKWVSNRLKEYESDNYILDNHFRPQVEFVGKKIQTFRFEDGMDVVFENISRMTGLQLEAGTHQRGNTVKFDLSWTPKVRDQVIEFYKDDFKMFGYNPLDEVKYLSLKSAKEGE